jgi:signal transduction histidine kinase
MWMLMMLWRVLVKVLRHLGWGILLVPVAAMGIVLAGLNPWTFAAVVLAAVLAVQWPTLAARALPPTMVWAGASGLVVAARTPGSPVNWVVDRLQAPFATRVMNGSLPAKAAFGPGGFPPALPRWVIFFPGTRGFQVSYGPPGLSYGPPGLSYRPAGPIAQGAAKSVTFNQIAQGAGAVKNVIVKGPGRGRRRVLIRRNVVVKGSVPRKWSTAPVPQKAFTKLPPSGPGRLFGLGQHAIGAPAASVTRVIHGVARPVGPAAGFWDGRLLVPVALLLLTLGLWLTPRSLAGLRGRGAALAPEVRRWLAENRWGVLLVPVTLLGLTVFGVHPWTIAAVIAAVVVLARWPRVAADLVPVLLAIFAVRGFELAANWQSMAAQFQGPRFGQPPAASPVLFGAVDVNTPATALLAGVEASVFLAFGAWLVPRTIGAHARTVFTPGTDVELAGRVQRLTESRSHAVDAATSELRRIERDLHDGAQARLVALGMNLRAAERVLPGNPQAALALVAEARETSVRALNELRNLIRGIYPPVLADRGLGHAIRALALDTPMPTELDIDLPGRLSAPVESACYFAVAEALANAVKHSGARRVQIRIRHAADILRIEVSDDGVGGADPARGTGLQGVERRLGTFDGILAVSSPPGGPTMIVMEVPCALSSPKTCSS